MPSVWAWLRVSSWSSEGTSLQQDRRAVQTLCYPLTGGAERHAATRWRWAWTGEWGSLDSWHLLLHTEGGKLAHCNRNTIHPNNGFCEAVYLYSKYHSRSQFSRALRSVHFKGLNLSPVSEFSIFLTGCSGSWGCPVPFLAASGALNDPREENHQAQAAYCS